jgi:hypothetical protein
MGKIKIVKIKYMPTRDREWRLKKAIGLLMGDRFIKDIETPRQAKKEFVKQRD